MQFYKNIELVFVADRCDLIDEAIEFATSIGLKLVTELVSTTYNRTQKFNTALGLCTGKWVVILDSDDVLPTCSLDTLDSCLRLYPGHDYFTSSQVHIGIKNEYLKKVEINPMEYSVNLLSSTFRQQHLWGFRRDAIGRFSQGLSHDYVVEDYQFFASAAMQNNVPLCIPYPLCCYRRHSQQITQTEARKIGEMVSTIRSKLKSFAGKMDGEARLSEMTRLIAMNDITRRLKMANLMEIDY